MAAVVAVRSREVNTALEVAHRGVVVHKAAAAHKEVVHKGAAARKEVAHKGAAHRGVVVADLDHCSYKKLLKKPENNAPINSL